MTYLTTLLIGRECDYRRRKISGVYWSYFVIICDDAVVAGVELHVVKTHILRQAVLPTIQLELDCL